MTLFYAQPYDLAANGFYFEDAESYTKKIGSIKNDYGEVVEEFEIQFIDGAAIDADLCKAIGLYQGGVLKVMELIDDLDEQDKITLIIACGECGYRFNPHKDSPSDFEVDIYPCENLKDLAEQFVDEGLYGDIPDSLAFYIDYEAIARDLAVDFSTIEIAGEQMVYACR